MKLDHNPEGYLNQFLVLSLDDNLGNIVKNS